MGSTLHDLAYESSRARVTQNDTSPKYLQNKLSAGANISLTLLNPGADERLEIAATFGGGGGMGDPGANGIMVRTALNTSIARQLAAGSSKVNVTNATGVAGNPTVDIVEANLLLQNLGGAVLDAQVPDTISISNITQIATRPHASLSSLAADDHSIYLLLAGRAGATNDPQLSNSTDGTILGTSISAGNLGLNATSHATKGAVRVQPNFANLTGVADQAAITFNPSATISNTGSSQKFSVFEYAPTFTRTGSAGGIHIVFAANGYENWQTFGNKWSMFGGSQVHDITNVAGLFPNVYLANDEIIQQASVDIDNNGGFIPESGGLRWARRYVTASGGTMTFIDAYAVKSAPTLQAASSTTALGTLRDFWAAGVSLGAGCTITTHIGLEIASALSGTTTRSIRSLGSANPMLHVGAATFGVNAAPNANLAMDLGGGFATRAANVALVNGNNAAVAIGNRSFLRITGPTGAFTINGIAGGVDGKIVWLYNTTAQNMTLANEDAVNEATAGNRLHTMTGANVVTVGEGAAMLVYDNTLARWLVFMLTA